MNYLIMFLVILAVLTLMFFAGYAMAYKRFSYYVARLREQLAEARAGEHIDTRAGSSSVNNLVVSNRSKSSQQHQQAAAPQRVAAATAARDYPASPVTRLAATNANANTGKSNQARAGQPAAPAPATRKRGQG